MSAQNEESNTIREQAQGTDDEDQLRVQDFRRIQESGYGFENDGEAQCDQEDGIEEGAEDLCPQPLCDVSEVQLSNQSA